MIIHVEPTPRRPGSFDAFCGAFHIKASRTPLLSMARRLLDAGFDPETELRMQHRGTGTDAMRVKLGDAAKLDVRERPNGPTFVKYVPREAAE